MTHDQTTRGARGKGGTRTRPASLETLAFTLELLKRIPRGRKITATELWKQLRDAGWQRDLRTVQRQLEELSAHFDIERDDRERPYGYCWKEVARGLSIPHLNETESLVLALAERHLGALLPADVMRAMQPFFSQARGTLGTASRLQTESAAGAWMDKVRVVSSAQPLLPPDIPPGVFDAVSRALYANQWLDIAYQNARGELVHGRIQPLGLAQQGERLYLVCRFEGYADDRSLALHRVRSVKETGLPFARPADFDLERFDDEGRFAFGQGEKVQIDILIRKQAGLHLAESRLAADQRLEDRGGNYRIRATVASTQGLVWWLRGFGDEVTVLAPARLARAVHPHRLREAA